MTVGAHGSGGPVLPFTHPFHSLARSRGLERPFPGALGTLDLTGEIQNESSVIVEVPSDDCAGCTRTEGDRGLGDIRRER